MGQAAIRLRAGGPDQRQRRSGHARQRLGDTIFPPNQYAKFYERLTGPKRLEFRPGDHATAEGTGLLGLPNDTWTNAHRWFDRYLKGERNGIDTEAPVQIKSRSNDGYEGYADWKSVGAGGTEKLALSDSEHLFANVDSGANGGILLLSSALDQFVKAPPIASIPLLPAPSPPSGSRGATTRTAGCAAR